MDGKRSPVENIPPMPPRSVDVPTQLLSRNTKEFGDPAMISMVKGLVGQGAAQLGILSRDVLMDGRSKSSQV